MRNFNFVLIPLSTHRGEAYGLGAQGQSKPVTVKMLSPQNGDREIFDQDIKMLASISHLNIVGLLAVCTKDTPECAILDAGLPGDLLSYIREKKSEVAPHIATESETKELMRIADEISLGMAYLASERFIHKDLALRNCIIGLDGVIKIAHFGLGPLVYPEAYYRANDTDLPIRWMSPEAITSASFTTMSDIWYLFSTHAKNIVKKLQQKSITLVRDEQKIIPISNISENIALLDIGVKYPSDFQKRMMQYGLTDTYRMSKGQGSNNLLNTLAQKDRVIVAFHDMSRMASKSFGIHHEDVEWLKALAQRTKVAVILFGNPYAMQYFDDIATAVVAYEDDEGVQDAAAQSIVGARALAGKLPVTASERSKGGEGLETASLFRLGFASPEEVGMSSLALGAIDTIMDEIIERKAAPGGQVLVIKDGQVIFQKAYGFHTYENKRKVENHHVYDLASVTKILASTYSIMDLFDKGKISVFRPLKDYLPDVKNTDKKDIIIEDMLIHSARLKPWIPFYKNTLNEKNKPSIKWYSRTQKEPYTLEVADKIYMHKEYVDSMWNYIYESELRSNNGYRYSDLGFYFADF